MSQKTCLACGNPVWEPYSHCYDHMMAYSYCDPDAGRDAQRERQVIEDDDRYLDMRYGRPPHLEGG